MLRSLKLLPTLSEAQTRWVVGREAVVRGWGGISDLHRLTGLSRPTITKGVQELVGAPPLSSEPRIRRAGGGRKLLATSQLLAVGVEVIIPWPSYEPMALRAAA